MIAAPASGSGKTVLTLALLRALKDRGLDIAGAKAGPDYIDPAFHAVSAGKPSVNLDPWAMTDARLASLAGAQGADYLLAEAMMGLFDGALDGSGATADVAARLRLHDVDRNAVARQRDTDRLDLARRIAARLGIGDDQHAPHARMRMVHGMSISLR